MEVEIEQRDDMELALSQIFNEVEDDAVFDMKEFFEKSSGYVEINGVRCQIVVKLITQEALHLDDDEIYWKDSVTEE